MTTPLSLDVQAALLLPYIKRMNITFKLTTGEVHTADLSDLTYHIYDSLIVYTSERGCPFAHTEDIISISPEIVENTMSNGHSLIIEYFHIPAYLSTNKGYLNNVSIPLRATSMEQVAELVTA